MPLVGNLRDFALHDFLSLVDRGYKTGSLLIKRPDEGAALFFDKGKLISALRPQHRERLGDMLVRLGKISQEQCDQALQHQQNGDARPLGQMLVEQGAIGQSELQACVQQQIEETVYELFAWPEGEFKFEAGMKPALDQIQALLPMPVENLIMEGVRRVDEMARIKERIPNNDMIVLLTDQVNQRAAHINMTAEEWKVFARINGELSINDIAQKTGLRTFDVSHVVFGLLTRGMVELHPPARTETETAVATGRQAEPAHSVGAGHTATPALKKTLVGRLIGRVRGS